MGFAESFEKREDILIQNLGEFAKKQNLAKQQKELTVLELARLYCEHYKSIDGILDALKKIGSELSVSELIVFLSEICHSELAENIKAMLFIGSTDPTTAGAHSKISYSRNKYNDAAFEHFSRFVANAKPDYASSFAECCESVYDGRCEFCILPIMNSSDGRLMSFYSLLDRYELKICETVDIDGDDTTSSFRHALVGRSCREQRNRISKNQRWVFEFSIIEENTDFLAPLFEAASKSEARLICVDSTPVEYAPDMQKFFFSFSLPTQNAIAFRLFVALKHQTHTPIGIYKETN